jgi:hypothetical protein
MGKTETASADDVGTTEEKAAKKGRKFELVGASRFYAGYLPGVISKGESICETSLKAPVVEKMDKLVKAGMFKILALVIIVLAAMGATAPAAAQTTGTNFTYQSKIGWGGAYLNTLPTVFAELDALYTSIGSATTLASSLGATTSGNGASLVGVFDTASYFTGTTVEAVLAELGLSRSKLPLTTSGNGASMIGVFDTATYFTGTDVEAVLAELGAYDASLGLTTQNNGASLIGVYDTATHFTGTDVETVLAELYTAKQNLVIPGAVGNIATLGADGQITDSGDGLAEYAKLITAPTNGNFACTDAFGQPTDCGSAPSDYVTTTYFEATGNSHAIINNAIGGALFPAAPADGYRLFCTAAGGAYDEGKIYTYTAGTGYDAGVPLLAGEMVQTRASDFILGGATLTDWVQLSDRPTRTALSTYMGISNMLIDAALPFGSIPAAPADKYRVLATTTGGAFVQGYVYTYSTDNVAYDAGEVIGDGHIAMVKGSTPDFIVGGTAADDYVTLSSKSPYPACKTITVTNPSTTGVSAADPDWIGATIYSIVPTSGCDQLIVGHSVAGDGVVTVETALTPGTACVVSACTFL